MSDIYPSMAAHCYYVPASITPAYEEHEEQPMELGMGANDVVFERKLVSKRGRDDEDYETTGQRCTYYRNSVAAIGAKRTKAVETQA